MALLPGIAWLSSLTILVACSVGPAAGWQGARLYASGSRALEQGEVARAIADLEAAAARVPHASEIHNHLGVAYARAGRHAEALAAFEQAVALDCDNAAAARTLAEARGRVGARPAARGAPAGATR